MARKEVISIIAKLWVFALFFGAPFWLTIISPIRTSTHCGSAGYLYIVPAPTGQSSMSAELHNQKLIAITDDSYLDGLDVICSVYVDVKPEPEFSIFNPWVTSVGDSQIRYNPMWGYDEYPGEIDFKQVVLGSAKATPINVETEYLFLKMNRNGVLAAMNSKTGIQYSFNPANMLKDISLLIFILGGIASAIYLIQVRPIEDPDLCPNCAYPKLGLPDSITACPECGQQLTMPAQLRPE